MAMREGNYRAIQPARKYAKERRSVASKKVGRPFHFVFVGPSKLIQDLSSTEIARITRALGRAPSQSLLRGLRWTLSVYVEHVQQFRGAAPRKVETQIKRIVDSAAEFSNALEAASPTASNLVSQHIGTGRSLGVIRRQLNEPLSELLSGASALTYLENAPLATTSASESKRWLANRVAYLVYGSTRRAPNKNPKDTFITVLVAVLGIAKKRMDPNAKDVRNARHLGDLVVSSFNRESADEFWKQF